MRVRGHDVTVLTSEHGKDKLTVPDPVWVHRDLHLEMELASLKNTFQFFTHRRKREAENLFCVKELIGHFKPDTVLIWGMWNLQRSIPAMIEKQMLGRTVYYMGDYWPTLPNQFENYWQSPPRNPFTGIPKLILKSFALRVLANEEKPDLKFEHVLFPTAFMQEEFKKKGITPANTKIVYGAIDTAPYLNEYARQADVRSLLYVGRLTHDKGVHTAIEAIKLLIREQGCKDVEFTIIGDGEPDYEVYLHQLVDKEELDSFVTFLPAQPKEKLPALYQKSGVFLFTSIWPEPFGRVIVEAMASGLAVVGTPVGGAAEILVDKKNALIFTPNDPASLAQQLRRLIDSPELRDRLSKAGRETAVSRFDIQRMISEIEAYLETIVGA